MESFSSQIESIASTLPDNIFVIGKGSSIDSIHLTDLRQQGFVINLNDSERILTGHLSIYKSEWAHQSISDYGFASDLYLTTSEFQNSSKPSYIANSAPQTQFSQDLLFNRFDQEEILLEEPIFITALKIASMLQKHKLTEQNIFMLGFDFDPRSGYSKLINDRSSPQKDFSDFIISSQENYFKEFLNFFNESQLNLIHVGIKTYSSIDSQSFNRLHEQEHVNHQLQAKHPEKKLLQRYEEIASSEQVIITAEFTTNHFGNMDTLESMIKKAKLDGADLVKVQKRNVDTFYTTAQLNSAFASPFGSTFRDYRNQLELSEEDFYQLDEICHEQNIPWFLSVLDETSFDLTRKISVPVIKLPSTISNFKSFLKSVSSSYKNDVIISTGMTDKNYEKFIVENFTANSRLFLLQCNSAYPTPPQHCNIAVISHYAELSKKIHNIVPGYSSHDVGSLASCLAVSAGAKMIEKHVKFGSNDWAHFDSVALDLTQNDFKNFVRDIRNAEIIYGSSTKSINSSEHHKY